MSSIEPFSGMMWQVNVLLLLFSTGKINGGTPANRTYMLFVSEDAPIGQTQMIDRFEQSVCSTYSIRPLQQHSPFEISFRSNGSCTLNLHVRDSLDREQKSMYTLEEELTDEQHLLIIQLSILVLDVNDHIPQFETEHFDFQVREDIQPGALIGRVQAYDPDILLNGKVSYRLVDNQTIFRVDRDTGEIFLADSMLDYERQREYIIMVEANDYGDAETSLWPSVSSYADVTIKVEDVNDEKPEIIVTRPEENQGDDPARMMSIAQPQLNAEQNRWIDSFYSTMHLLEHDAALVPLAKEEPVPAHTLLALLHLHDRDQVSAGFLSLNFQTYVQCAAEEVLINNLTFCRETTLFHLSILRSNVYGLFTSRILDREEHENYILHFIADDNDNSTSKFFQSESFVYLTLLDINDNNPVFTQNYIHVKIDENQAKKSVLTRVHAHDIDKGPNGTVHYELLVKNNPLFTLDKYSGILRTKVTLDREQCELYRIGIGAYDLGFPERKHSSIILVDVEVNNLNDQMPYFMHESYHFQLLENTPTGKIVGRLTIGDKDEQEPIERMIDLSTDDDDEELYPIEWRKISRIEPSTIDFLFVDSQQNQSLSGLFSIDSQGFIYTLASLDRELQSNYSLYVSMYDSTLNSYALPSQVLIDILDENDNPPYEPFLANASILSVEQIDTEETIIYQFQPIDHDVGLNALVSIECLNCSSIFYFSITNSSILTTRPALTIPDGLYTLAFLVRDHGPSLSHRRFYTLTFHLTHPLKQTSFSFPISWHYFPIIWFLLLLILLWSLYRYYQVPPTKLPETVSKIVQPNEQHLHNLNSIATGNRPQSHPPSTMNSRETMLTHAIANTPYREENEEIWQAMNKYPNEPVLYENTIAYQFQSLDRDCSSNSSSSQGSTSHSIQRPIPISHNRANSTTKQHAFPAKRNSTMHLDCPVRPSGLPRSVTSDHLANRLYYYPSVQDVLDALNRRSFEKESFV